MFASFAKDSNAVDTFVGQSTMEDYDLLQTEQDEAYGKIVCDRNFSYMSQYNKSFLNRSVCQKRDCLIKNMQKITAQKKKQTLSNSFDPSVSTQRESDITQQPPQSPKMINLEKYGLQAQVKQFFDSRPKTQAQTLKKVASPKSNQEPAIILGDYQFDNRKKFDLFNQERGRNSGLQQILNKMHIGPRNATTTLTHH